MLISEKDIGTLFQPMKPVFTGTKFNPVTELNEIVYVKSSSIPLIPQMTIGTERIHSEEPWKSYSMKVW